MNDRRLYPNVLFDVDGTLIDSNSAHADAWVTSLIEHGVSASVADVRPLIGMGADKVLPIIAHVTEDSELGKSIAERRRVIFEQRLPTLQPTRGARSMLEYARAREWNLTIVSSSGSRDLRALLKQAGVADLVPRRTSKDDAGGSKPDPDIVRAALRKSAASPELTVMVGDTPYDIESASRAGVASIALRSGGYWPDSSFAGAIAVFDDPAALLMHWRDLP